MISFLSYFYLDRTIVGLYNHVLISRCEKKFVIPLLVGLRYIFYAHRSAMFTR